MQLIEAFVQNPVKVAVAVLLVALGTGAAVAASFAAVGMGSDTCGSIRGPSAPAASTTWSSSARSCR